MPRTEAMLLCIADVRLANSGSVMMVGRIENERTGPLAGTGSFVMQTVFRYADSLSLCRQSFVMQTVFRCADLPGSFLVQQSFLMQAGLTDSATS